MPCGVFCDLNPFAMGQHKHRAVLRILIAVVGCQLGYGRVFLSVKLSSIATYDSQMWPLREVHYILTWTLQQVEDNLLLPYQIFSSCSAEHLNIKDDKISVNFAKASSQSTPKPKGKEALTSYLRSEFFPSFQVYQNIQILASENKRKRCEVNLV